MSPAKRGKLLATRPDGAKLYQVEEGKDGGTVVIVLANDDESPVMKLGTAVAMSPYWRDPAPPAPKPPTK